MLDGAAPGTRTSWTMVDGDAGQPALEIGRDDLDRHAISGTGQARLAGMAGDQPQELTWTIS